MAASCADGLRTILNDRKIFLLGGIQTMVESCMYIFVFLWTPVLMPAHPPLGMVFACFMVAIMIGSSAYTLLLSRGHRSEDVLRLCLVTISLSMATCCLTADNSSDMTRVIVTFSAFLIMECAFGAYFPAMSYCKSRVIPESHRANVMNWFRVPMNVITCATLLCLHVDWVAEHKRVVFGFCVLLGLTGVVLASKFRNCVVNNGSKNVNVSEEQEKLMDHAEDMG